MPRTLNRLSSKQVDAKKERGYYADGGGLYLQVSHVDTKSWVFRFTRSGKTREMGLGPLHTISLAEARVKALECRKKLLNGVDPIEARKAEKAAEAFANAKIRTFKQCAEAYIESHRDGWKNEKHASQWENTLETYAYPYFGSLSVAMVDTGLVMKCLEAIWKKKPETASRLRGRIESVLDWATVRGYRTGGNPARWKGHLDTLLPARSKVAKIEHHPALSYSELGKFMASLKLEEGIAAQALQFTILTAARTNEVLGAAWGEFDLGNALWVVPAERMKMKKEHRVPISPPAMNILDAMRDKGGAYVFPGRKEGDKLSNMSMLAVLKRMGRPDLTAHGFRSTFRDWAAETTAYPSEVVEMALAHVVGNKVEAAYRRGDLFDKRRRLMDDWAKYCAKPVQAGAVVPIRKGKST